jgi:ribosomal protein S12 methylthiotransferase accessory factor
VDIPTSPFDGAAGFASRDARDDVEWLIERLEDAGCPQVVVVDYSVDRIAPARVVRVIIPGLETTNPFYSGPRARVALLRDLLPCP